MIFERYFKPFIIGYYRFDLDGVRLAQNTSLGILVSRPFQLKINELTYNVESPQELGIETLPAL